MIQYIGYVLGISGHWFSSWDKTSMFSIILENFTFYLNSFFEEMCGQEVKKNDKKAVKYELEEIFTKFRVFRWRRTLIMNTNSTKTIRSFLKKNNLTHEMDFYFLFLNPKIIITCKDWMNFLLNKFKTYETWNMLVRQKPLKISYDSKLMIFFFSHCLHGDVKSPDNPNVSVQPVKAVT